MAFAARVDLIRYRLMADSVPEEIASLVAHEHETAWKDTGRKQGDDGKIDRSMFGTDKKKGRVDKDIVREKPPQLRQAENAWKPRTPTAKGEITMLPRLHEMQRTVSGVLNKVFELTKRMPEFPSDDEDGKKALAEPHYCETYAD